MMVWTQEIFHPFAQQLQECDIPQQILEWSHKESGRVNPPDTPAQIQQVVLTQICLQDMEYTSAAWDQRRKLAMSTSQFLKPLLERLCNVLRSG